MSRSRCNVSRINTDARNNNHKEGKSLAAKKIDEKEAKNRNGYFKKRVFLFIQMIVILFFWYFGLNNISYYVRENLGNTTIGNFYYTIISVFSAVVYAYLILGIVKSDKINIKVAFIATSVMVFFSIISMIVFPLPLVP